MNNDIYFMKIAYKQAMIAKRKSEIPVGAVIVENDEIIAKGHNNRNKRNIITAHAEINAIIIACRKKNNWRLNNCILYVTLEPCDMCKEIIKESRIKKVIYGTSKIRNPESNNIKYEKLDSNDINIQCSQILTNQFKCIREENYVSRET